MTAKNTADSPEDDSLGVLDDAASLDTAGIGILGGTAQVNVAIPTGDEDDLIDDDGVVEGEVADLIVDEPAPAVVGRIEDGSMDIVIEVPAEDLPAAPEADAGDPVIAEVVPEEVSPGREISDEMIEGQVEALEEDEKPAAEPPLPESSLPESSPRESSLRDGESAASSETVSGPAPDAAAAPAPAKPRAPKQPKRTGSTASADVTPPAPKAAAKPTPADSLTKPAMDAPAAKPATEPVAKPTPSTRPTSPWVASVEQAAAGAASESAEKANEIVSTDKDTPSSSAETSLAPRAASAPARAEVELTSKRLGDQLGQASRESADLLTADRLLDPHQVTKPEPEGAWSHFLYTISGRRINIGDGRRAKARKALSAKIAAPLNGGARFVPVLSRKGGVGKTTITALLGMALADARDDRVIAVDANPDRGTLAERIVRGHGKSVRDLVRVHDEVRGYHDISAIVARDATRLDVLASDSDPRIADAFGDADYRDVADVAAHYYSLVLTDTGTGIVHSVMGATLELADQLIIVSGLSVDEARLASETLTWLETNGYADQAREAIVVLNQSTPGSPLVRLNELEAHFATRARHVVRMPYDSQIAGGGPIVFAHLQPETRQSARELAALLVEGLRAQAA